MPAVLQVRDLRTSILKRVSFTLSAAECIAVKGPSGAGKTLLLRAIADLDPNQGQVSLEGCDRSTIPGPDWTGVGWSVTCRRSRAGGQKSSASISAIGPRPPLFSKTWDF